jgi:ElaB/YqjD/DUF883 family membrane-anchored ribosome-binding protein
MTTTETARLERETEETRAQLESTLFELRARMSPGSLMDQATDYLRGSSGRAFVSNLRDQVVENPVPVTLIGAGIAWLALLGALGRRGNGNGRADIARDWIRTDTTAYGMADDADRRSVAQRARDTAESWAERARSAASETGEAVREGMDNLRDRAGTLHDETVGQAREAASDAGNTLRHGMHDVGQQARHMAHKAADFGHTARRAVQSDGALMTFCREQPMLVAGMGITVGAVLGALIPASRAETRVMGEASREVLERARQAAAEGLRAATNGGRDEQRAGNEADRAAADIDRSVDRASRHPNTETEPQEGGAPYAESPEAGAASEPGTSEATQPG